IGATPTSVAGLLRGEWQSGQTDRVGSGVSDTACLLRIDCELERAGPRPSGTPDATIPRPRLPVSIAASRMARDTKRPFTPPGSGLADAGTPRRSAAVPGSERGDQSGGAAAAGVGGHFAGGSGHAGRAKGLPAARPSREAARVVSVIARS